MKTKQISIPAITLLHLDSCDVIATSNPTLGMGDNITPGQNFGGDAPMRYYNDDYYSDSYYDED